MIIINVYEKCDGRPLVYSLLHLFQNYGDLVLVTTNKQYLKLSDTAESGGYYQNVRIDFIDSAKDFDQTNYNHRFEYVLFVGEALATCDIYIPCASSVFGQEDSMKFKEHPATCKFGLLLYAEKPKYFKDNLPTLLETFETTGQCINISDYLAEDIADNLADYMHISTGNLYSTMTGKARRKGIKLPALIRRRVSSEK